jgi:hypothetical protein
LGLDFHFLGRFAERRITFGKVPLRHQQCYGTDAILMAVDMCPGNANLLIETDSKFAIGLLTRGWKTKHDHLREIVEATLDLKAIKNIKWHLTPVIGIRLVRQQFDLVPNFLEMKMVLQELERVRSHLDDVGHHLARKCHREGIE